MYLFLLVFGVILSVAGVVLAASGLSVHDHTFDLSLVTPGIVSVAGGLLLVGLGFALRVLQRIESALAVRPAVPVGEPIEAGMPAGTSPRMTAVPEPPSEPVRIPFPMKTTRLPQTAAGPAPFAPTAEKRTEDMPQKFSRVARGAPAPAIEDVELSPRPPASPNGGDDDADRADHNVGPFGARVVKTRNGVAPAGRMSARLDMSARAPINAERPKGPEFDALWPKGPRPARATAQTKPKEAAMEAPAIPVAAPDPLVEEEVVDPAPAVASDEAPEPITILKSGVVDGMAYTLYSDGSIEAQLPQGMLRFGSITELRAHIEQDSQT
jgi:hypothetical protein